MSIACHFNFSEEQYLKEKDKDKLKKNNKEKGKIDNNSKKGTEEMRKELIEKKSFDI